jgi:hypothetical protein
MKETLVGLGVGVTAVGTLMTGIVSMFSSKRTIDAASNLEEVKKKIVVEIEAKKGELAKELATFNQSLQKELQLLKLTSDRQIEMMKATTLSREIDAYQELFAAADQYYSSLSKLETSEWKDSDYAECEARMVKARPKLPYLKSEEHQKLWEQIWTKAVLLARSAQATPDDRRSSIWIDHVAEFGAMLKEFSAVVAKEFPRP